MHGRGRGDWLRFVSHRLDTTPAQERSSDVVNALLALGYSEKEAHAAIKGLAPGVPVAEGIRAALKALAKS
jgi:Holliday junction DNA helicase RuvA